MRSIIGLIILALFVPQFTSAAICASAYTADVDEVAFNVPKGDTSFTWMVGMPFTPASDCTLSSVVLRLKKAVGSPTDVLNVQIWSSTGSVPNAVVATCTNLDPTPLTSSYATTSTACSGSLTGGTQYWLSVNRTKTTVDNANYVVSASANSPSVTACAKGAAPGTWATTGDYCPKSYTFEIEGSAGGGAAPFSKQNSWWFAFW